MSKLMKIIITLLVCLTLVSCVEESKISYVKNNGSSLENIPTYNNVDLISLNNDKPLFSDEEKTSVKTKIVLSSLDSLERCGKAMEVIGEDMFPSEKRKSISEVRPTGWHQAIYGDLIVYNRTHLLGYLFSGLNSEKRNLITATENLNQDIMAPIEISIKKYIQKTKNHVVYRVTPDFKNDELVARGVQIEAYSIEDKGKGICMNKYIYNVQKGVAIDYKTGYTSSSEYVQNQLKNKSSTYKINMDEKMTFVINKNNSKFHTSSCSYGHKIRHVNKQEMVNTGNEMLKNGYEASKCCIIN